MNTKSILLILSVVLISACSSFHTGKDRSHMLYGRERGYNREHPEEAHIEGMFRFREWEAEEQRGR